MRTKKEFSFDELRDAERIINSHASIDYGKMYLIAKYFRHVQGYGAIRLEKELIRFCKDRDKNFNPIIEAKLIRKWIKVAMIYNLRKIDEIPISNGEIEFLKEIDNEKERRLLFATLVFSRALKNSSPSGVKAPHHYIHYSNFLDIIRLSKVSGITELGFAKMLHKYKNYFMLYSPERELVKLEYAEDYPRDVIIIEHPENTAGYYDMIFGERRTVKQIRAPIRYCVICGKKLEKTSPRQKACPEHTKELARLRTQKWRSKKEKA